MASAMSANDGCEVRIRAVVWINGCFFQFQGVLIARPLGQQSGAAYGEDLGRSFRPAWTIVLPACEGQQRGMRWVPGTIV